MSNDSYIGSPSRLAARTIDQVERQNGGIVLFHDIKASTAHALPTILTELKKRGYKIVHMRSKSVFEPLPALTAELEAKRALAEAKKSGKKGEAAVAEKPKLVPFFFFFSCAPSFNKSYTQLSRTPSRPSVASTSR